MNTFPTKALATVTVPGHGRFHATAEALEMIAVFGGSLHCYLGSGGCRTQGLYFSRTRPKKFIGCTLETLAEAHGPATISVSYELADRINGAVLDFGNYNRMQRFVWTGLPAVKGPQCTCLRSMGKPAGKRSPCLDDAGMGITDL
ncbi:MULTISPECIES: peptidase [unclassified Arthrobacter]|uniref:peptidase n=1 Tax=unclassified Arthrobacter TaxID=235627 RepID=UPI001BB507F6|nr:MULTISPECIES: peptidase [unclassified Arthrobacter]QSZ51375.1 peptidase [Arthrobacter sp. D5-1]